jgi:hypothetical protein
LEEDDGEASGCRPPACLLFEAAPAMGDAIIIDMPALFGVCGRCAEMSQQVGIEK